MLCHANCPKCGMPTDQFMMFESGPGGDFETYVGATSGTLYRLDLGKVHYQKLSREDLLADAFKKETRLICIPKELSCKICGTVFSATNIPIDGEEIVDAFEV
jgi:rubredoxin